MVYYPYDDFTNFLKEPLLKRKKGRLAYFSISDNGNCFEIYLKWISTSLGCEFIVPLAKPLLVPSLFTLNVYWRQVCVS